MWVFDVDTLITNDVQTTKGKALFYGSLRR
jgi:hypothetical protein